MSHLFASTDLERSYRVNLNVIGLDQKPQVKTLVGILKEWLKHREEVVTRRITWRLEKINERLHVLEGLLVAYINLDEVIRIVREEDDPKGELMRRFSLSDIQASAILDIRLRQLARLEEVKLVDEKNGLEAEKEACEKLLGSRARLRTLIKKELLEDADSYGDARRSPLASVEEATAYSEEDLVSNDPITVVLSEKGWVRAAKGHELDPAELAYKTGDSYGYAVRGRTNELLAFLDSTGRSYNVQAASLPSARGQGEPLTGRLNPPEGARFVGACMGPAGTRALLCSTAGFGFVGGLSDMVTKNKAGKACVSVPAGGSALPPGELGAGDGQRVAAVTSQGRLLVFPLGSLPQLARGKGVKLINIPTAAFKAGEEHLVGAAVLGRRDALMVYAGQRYLRLKPKDLEHYTGERARRGLKLPRGFQRVDAVAAERRG